MTPTPSPPCGSVSSGVDSSVDALAPLVDLPDRLCAEVRHHIREMYPEAVKAAPGTFLLSVGNCVRNLANSIICQTLDDYAKAIVDEAVRDCSEGAAALAREQAA